MHVEKCELNVDQGKLEFSESSLEFLVLSSSFFHGDEDVVGFFLN
jgi:hypothetical protein